MKVKLRGGDGVGAAGEIREVDESLAERWIACKAAVAVEEPEEPEKALVETVPEDLTAKTIMELREIAKDIGEPAAGSKAELISRITEKLQG